MTKKQKRMKEAVKYLKEYMESYDKQRHYLDFEDVTLIDDVLYGLGVALGGEKYKFASGYAKFQKVLREHLSEKVEAK